MPGVTCEMGLMVEWHCFGWPVPGSQIVGRSREEARDHENYRFRFYDLQTLLGSLSKDVFQQRTSTGGGAFPFLLTLPNLYR